MTAIEVLLLVIGIVFLVASFFITEKLTPGELSKIGELSNKEIQNVMEQELKKVSFEISDRVENEVQESLEKSSQLMEKECNDKIGAIGEYSDTIVESMNKTHNEIMFLYSMLNDKHSELTDLAARLQKLSSDLSKQDETLLNHLSMSSVSEPSIPAVHSEPELTNNVEDPFDLEFEQFRMEMEGREENHNQEILALHKEGKTPLEIARALSVGLGEIQLVIGLYEGKRKS